jgi:hypothetical protein
VLTKDINLKEDRIMAYNLYIGANNKTGKVEWGTIERILNKRHKGYTLAPVIGYWQGKQEKSCMAIIEAEAPLVMQSLHELQRELKQDSIGYQQVNEVQFS